MRKAKENGVSGDEIAEIYAPGLLRRLAQGVGGFQTGEKISDGKRRAAQRRLRQGVFFPIGKPNMAYEKYFKGRSYTEILSGGDLRCQRHLRAGVPKQLAHTQGGKGGGQLLLCVSGRGWYREWGGGRDPCRRETRWK